MSEITRHPAVAGMFYPLEPHQLKATIESSFLNFKFGPGRLPSDSIDSKKIYGIISPHAGYTYSGSVAANGYYQISASDFDSAVIVGPNHYGLGSGVATVRNGTWETPIGKIKINEDLAFSIANNSPVVDFDNFAHSKDHCIEVQLPFLQVCKRGKEFTIVPIILIMQDKDTATQLGLAIANAVQDLNAILIASSDFTHYESNEEAHRKDGQLIKSILELDVAKFYTTLERHNISACGYGAIAAVMTAVKEMGASKGELLKYATSGDVTGDNSAVVGYSSILFT